jgi:hypothetical protein
MRVRGHADTRTRGYALKPSESRPPAVHPKTLGHVATALGTVARMTDPDWTVTSPDPARPGVDFSLTRSR